MNCGRRPAVIRGFGLSAEKYKVLCIFYNGSYIRYAVSTMLKRILHSIMVTISLSGVVVIIINAVHGGGC